MSINLKVIKNVKQNLPTTNMIKGTTVRMDKITVTITESIQKYILIIIIDKLIISKMLKINVYKINKM